MKKKKKKNLLLLTLPQCWLIKKSSPNLNFRIRKRIHLFFCSQITAKVCVPHTATVIKLINHMQTCQIWFCTRFVTLIKTETWVCVCVCVCVCYKDKVIAGREEQRQRQGACNIQLMAGLYLLLKMHFVRRKNCSATAEEVLWAYVDVMHYGPQAQMIHEKKGTCVIWGVRTGISLNYYYREGETCIRCAIK